MNDVSYLYPLPKAHEESMTLLSGVDSGPKGELLPYALFEKLENPVQFEADRKKLYSQFRMVGFRIDPEHRTVRMVWQPVFRAASPIGAWTTEDGAVHTFYALAETEFQNLLKRLQALKKEGEAQTPRIRTARMPLGVHPAFRHAVFGPVFRDALKMALLEVCGERSLTQATFMQLTVKEIWWKWGGLKLEGSEFKPIQIPRMDSTTQDLFQESLETDPRTGHATGMKAAMLPHFPENTEMDLRPVVRAYHPANEADRIEFRQKLSDIHRIENPELIKNEAFDCVHCHLVGPAKTWMKNDLPELEISGRTDRDRYRNPRPLFYDLSNTTVSTKSTKIFRAFGYFGTEPAVNQRAIHESARVADLLSR